MKSDPKTQKAKLAADLRRMVLTLECEPGAQLDEVRLSVSYGLSRTPLREVFRELAGEGYIALAQNRGARVADMTHRTLRAFFQAAPLIYGAILQLAAGNATSEQISRLKQAQSDFSAALRSGDVVARTLANNRFHAITGEMADNSYLLASLNRLLIDHARIGMTFYRPRDASMAENLGKASAQHDAMIAAIEDGESAAAGALAIDHWNLSRGQIESFVMPMGLDAPLGDLPGIRTA